MAFKPIHSDSELLNRIQNQIADAFRDIIEGRVRIESFQGVATGGDAVGVTPVQGEDEPVAPTEEEPVVGLPKGGSTDQILSKRSNRDHDVLWRDEETQIPIGGQRIPSKDFPITTLIGRNLTGMADSETTRFILDIGIPNDQNNPHTLRAYEIETEAEDQPKDIVLDSSNQNPAGVASYLRNIFVGQSEVENSKIIGYTEASGFLDFDLGFNLYTARSLSAIDIDIDNEFLYILKTNIVESFPLVPKEFSKRIVLHPDNFDPRGIVVHVNVVYVVDGTANRVFAYNAITSRRMTDLEFNLSSANSDPRGMSRNGLGKFYILEF